jgi:hypothetical protein
MTFVATTYPATPDDEENKKEEITADIMKNYITNFL